MVTRWGNDAPEFRELSSKMLTTFLMTMRSTPYYYFGDELGMTNVKFDKIEDYQDIMTINLHKLFQSEGRDVNELLESHKITGRDNGRTPFQWNDSENGGFTTGKPWLTVNPDYTEINAAAQESDENSVLNYFRKTVRFRKENLVLTFGKYTLVDKDNPNVYAYTRELDDRKLLILLNFTARKSAVNTGSDVRQAKMLMGNYPAPSTDGELEPYEAVILEL